MGYWRAGFEVWGVDIEPQPNYPFAVLRHDALAVLDGATPIDVTWFDAIHASPPCQPDSAMSSCRPGLAETYARLIEPLRVRLIETGLPYVIENVVGAALINPITLCGTMFGLELYRHRLFESNVFLTEPEHHEHTVPASKAGHWKPGTIMSVAGHVAPMAKAREVMGIDWTTREELVEAIPPAYSEFVGKQLLAYVEERKVA